MDRARIGGHPIDHVLFGGRDLDRLRSAVGAAGLDSEYGGVHGDGRTHNDLIGFPDGSYVELIALVDPDADPPPTEAAIAGDAGPCGWAIEPDDIDAEAERLSDLGVPVEGPFSLSRERPDGQVIEWDLAWVGGRKWGPTLPFLIEDRTPRERRITPTPGIEGTGLTGVARVVVGVADLGESVGLFRRVFDLAEPRTRDAPDFGARIAWFPDAPLAIAEPRGGWLDDRIERFGARPCAYLLGAREFDAAAERFDLDPGRWFDRPVGWLDVDFAGRIGVLG